MVKRGWDAFDVASQLRVDRRLVNEFERSNFGGRGRIGRDYFDHAMFRSG